MVENFSQSIASLPLEFSPGDKWNYSVATDICGRLVEVFKDEDELEKLLSRFGSSRVDLEGRTPGHKLQAFNQVYSIDCHLNIPNKIRKVDVRDFFPHDTGCKFDGTQKISSTSCCFLGRVLSDSSLRSAYPLMQIASENVHVLE